MDSAKTGALIRKLRREKGMTQRQLAEKLHVSDKAVSKWERGMGTPETVCETAIFEMRAFTFVPIAGMSYFLLRKLPLPAADAGSKQPKR